MVAHKRKDFFGNEVVSIEIMDVEDLTYKNKKKKSYSCTTAGEVAAVDWWLCQARPLPL